MSRRKPFLRVYADDALPLVKTIRDQHQALHAAHVVGDREAELAASGSLGEAYRSLGQLDKAIPHLERAVALAREVKRTKSLVANLVRLATAYQYANRHDEALPLFEEALKLAPAVGFGEDYANQHFGKCLAEMARWDAAIACFERAVAIREKGQDAALLASSQEALAEAKRTKQSGTN